MKISSSLEHRSRLITLPSSFPPPTRFFPPMEMYDRTQGYICGERQAVFERCFHERCVSTPLYYTRGAKHVRLVGGKQRGTKTRPISIPRDGPTRPSQRVKRIFLSLSNGDLRCSFQAYDRMGGRLSSCREGGEGCDPFPETPLTAGTRNHRSSLIKHAFPSSLSFLHPSFIKSNN